MNFQPTKNFHWLIIFSLIGLSVYFIGIGIQYYEDDFQFVFNSPSSKLFYYFFNNNPENNFYRPIQASFLAFIQTYFGLNTVPIHITQIFMHILLAWLVFTAMLKLGFSKTQAVVGAIFMIISQANAHAVLSLDTLSQISGVLFGCISIFLFYLFTINTQNTNGKIFTRNAYYYLSVLTLFLAYLSKESSISYFPILLGVIVLTRMKQGRTFPISQTIVTALPFIFITLLYLVARSFIVEAHPSFGNNRYDFHIGINIIQNQAMFLFAASTPISSVTIFSVFKNAEFIHFAIAMIITLVFLFLVVYGWWFSKQHRKLLILFGIFAIISLFPMALMNRVSELYVYNCMPFISIIVGAGLGIQLKRCQTSRIKYGLIMVVMSLLVISQVVAVQSKALLMKANGERATRLLNEIIPYLDQIPEKGALFLLNPPSTQVEYSVFLIRGFNVFKGGLHRIKDLSGRYDLSINIIEYADLEKIKAQQACLILKFDDERVYSSMC